MRVAGSWIVSLPTAEVVAEVVELTGAVVEVSQDALVGVYVHGSAVLGDFQPGRSDLDVLLVVEDDTEEAAIRTIAATLAQERPSMAVGLEASVVERSDALRARPPWRFRTHVSTAPTDRTVVFGVEHPGDPDLALHYVVARHSGWASTGPPPAEVFGPLDRQLILDHLAAELRWAAVEAPTTYAVLNACRALRFADDSTICSKTEGGRWVVERGLCADIVTSALAHRSGQGPPPSDEARAWVARVAQLLR